MVVAGIGLATLGILLFGYGDEEPRSAASAEHEPVLTKQVARTPSTSTHAGRRLRIGEVYPNQEEHAATAPTILRQVKEGTAQSKSELEWDQVSSAQRRIRVAEAIAQGLGDAGGNPSPENRAELAQLLAAARADFFATEEGRAQFIALETQIGD